MKILDLKIEGFRSLKSVHWQPGDVNLLIGPNAGGKSNLLQALEMITESAQGKLSDFINNQGGMQSVLYDGKENKINVALKIRNSDSKNIYSYDAEITRLGNTSSCKVERESLNYQDSSLMNRSAGFANILDGSAETIITIGENIEENELLLSKLYYPYVEDKRLFDLHKQITSWNIYCYFDIGPKTDIRKSFTTNYKRKVEKEGKDFIAVLHTLYEEDREFKQEINSAMRAAFGEDYEELSFPPAANQQTQLALKWKSLKSPQYSSVLSDGTLRFLYLLTILADPDPPALIAIDEPEVGLHPRMLPIIAEYALEASRRTQVILATHSPEMLSAVGRQQSEATVTVAEWEEGQTKLSVLKGDKLNYWLKEYTLGEMFRSGQLENMA